MKNYQESTIHQSDKNFCFDRNFHSLSSAIIVRWFCCIVEQHVSDISLRSWHSFSSSFCVYFSMRVYFQPNSAFSQFRYIARLRDLKGISSSDFILAQVSGNNWKVTLKENVYSAVCRCDVITANDEQWVKWTRFSGGMNRDRWLNFDSKSRNTVKFGGIVTKYYIDKTLNNLYAIVCKYRKFTSIEYFHNYSQEMEICSNSSLTSPELLLARILHKILLLHPCLARDHPPHLLPSSQLMFYEILFKISWTKFTK